MYAAAAEHEQGRHPDTLGLEQLRAYSSSDEGATWMLMPASPSLQMLSLYPCASNDAHICGYGFNPIRAYRVEYAPELTAWTVLRAADPNVIAGLPAEEYFGGTAESGTSPCCYRLRATLENYSRYPFRSALSLPGLRMHTSSGQYRFRRGEVVKVSATIELRQLDPPMPELALPDIDHTQECWGLKYIDPDGIRKRSHSTIPSGTMLPAGTVHALNVEKPYQREVNLSDLMNFEKLGIYEVQLLFNNGAVVKHNSNEWTGYFSGERFVVIIER